MINVRRFFAVGISAVALVASGTASATASATAPTLAPVATAAAGSAAQHTVRLCPVKPAPGQASCFGVARVGAAPRGPRLAPPGLTPADLTAAYRLPSATAGAGQTIAIIDAFGYAAAETDLAVYRAQYGLPSCTTANGCLRKVNQSGGHTSPRFDLGWAQETALDLDLASAICPRCRLLLVQATTPAYTDLGTAVNTAARLGATVISNSYGGLDASDAVFGKYYRHPGVAITASTGDDGYLGAVYPASSSFVTAVGGTSLLRNAGTTRGWSERAWSGSGSGCSKFNPALAAAAASGTGCAKRAMADVSAVADPNTGVAVFARTGKYSTAWQIYGGTSAAAPIIAGIYALAGNAATATNGYPYRHTAALFDVTQGANGLCAPVQWCTARAGWDGPTGLGSPNGVGAF